MLHNIPEIQPDWLKKYLSKNIEGLEKTEARDIDSALEYIECLVRELKEDSLILEAFMAAAIELKQTHQKLFALKYVRDSLEPEKLKLLKIKEEVLMDQGVGWLDLIRLCREICEEDS